MPQHPGLTGARDVFQKMQREASRVRGEVTLDNFFNFAVTAWHLCDWIEKDPAMPRSARQALTPLKAGTWLQMCRDIANGSKHFTLTYAPTITEATAKAGYGVGRYGAGAYGVGELSIQLTMASGAVHNGLDVVKEVENLWTAFFAAYGTSSEG